MDFRSTCASLSSRRQCPIITHSTRRPGSNDGQTDVGTVSRRPYGTIRGQVMPTSVEGNTRSNWVSSEEPGPEVTWRDWAADVYIGHNRWPPRRVCSLIPSPIYMGNNRVITYGSTMMNLNESTAYEGQSLLVLLFNKWWAEYVTTVGQNKQTRRWFR